MQIDADWLSQKSTQRIFDMLLGAGHVAYVVGGCVRNALLSIPVADIDISTDARPEEVMELSKTHGLKAVPTGIEHGTVTVVADDEPFEITTFRKDIETDGRRAVVAFSKDMKEDALRRDFTMNALYGDAQGKVHDPLGGLPDLKSRRVRFIEDADKRIREDYLRSLRFFRFHAWYGDQSEGFDPDALDAIARNVEGISGLSRERVGSELKRLLDAPDPCASIAGMRCTGVLASVLPGADDTALGPLVALEEGVAASPDALRRLAVLGGEGQSEALRLSKKDAATLSRITKSMGQSVHRLGYELGAKLGRDAYLIDRAIAGQPVVTTDIETIEFAAQKLFPVNASDLLNDFEGPALGAILRKLETAWIESEFTLSRETLLGLATKG